MKEKSCVVLLSTYNGEKYLDQQLESLIAQNGVRLSILIRDDGSSDGTIGILKRYQKKYKNIKVVFGKNIGYAKSFWWLLQNSGKFDYYAFCDQDDVWLPDKIFRAVTVLEKNDPKEPLLYTSNVVPVDDNMNRLRTNTFKENRVLSVYESFQKSILPGCTFVFNSVAREIAMQYNGYMEFHDWCLYVIVNVFGTVLFDKESKIKYRVHADNVVGQKKGMRELSLKIKRFFKKSICSRSRFAHDFYEQYKNELPSRYKKSIMDLAYYRNDARCKKDLLFSRDFVGTKFKVLVLLNRV